MRSASFACSAVAALLLTVSAIRPAAAQSLFPPPVPHRDSIVARIRDLRKISTPEGIDTLQRLAIDGSQQWISIRGLNRNNPILLFIHGGPGAAMMGSAWAYQGPWEDYFTVVQWEQRGVGKNHVDADTSALAPTMSVERMVTDAKAVVAQLRRQFGRDFNVPIIIMQGRYDLHTPYTSARDYFETIRSPHKRFITFERSAHYPMFEESGRFLVTLVQEVLPLTTERAVFRVLP